MDLPLPSGDAPAKPAWKPLNAVDRRVLGTLIEKQKTTPDAYPMTINGLRAGCNQKSNRDPLMDLSNEDLEESLDRLRNFGVAEEIQGGGRVAKFRSRAYQWLGVDKVEMAVMAELLLRGAQTEGELRGRASRMEPINDLTALRTLLQSLKSKGLVIPLTPEGRGHMVTHALYSPNELERVKAQARALAPPADDPAPAPAPMAPSGPVNLPPLASTTTPAAAALTKALPGQAVVPREPQSGAISSIPPALQQELDSLRKNLAESRDQIAELRSQIQDLSTQQQQTASELQSLKQALGV